MIEGEYVLAGTGPRALLLEPAEVRMVENANEFVARDARSRGTSHCIAAARRAGVPVDVLGP